MIIPSVRTGLNLRFTVWHDDVDALAAIDSVVKHLFTSHRFTFEGHVFSSDWTREAEKLIEAGTACVDEDGVMPSILGVGCRLTTTGMGDRPWKLFVVG